MYQIKGVPIITNNIGRVSLVGLKLKEWGWEEPCSVECCVGMLEDIALVPT